MITRNTKETIALGEKLGRLLNRGDVIALQGDLAGGKTTFTKGIGQALDIKEVINSPTFTILKIYKGKQTLYHIDAYRLENNEYDLGIDEYEDEGIMVIEWPEYYKRYLPKEYLEIVFAYLNDEERQIDFVAHGPKYEKIAEVMNVYTMH